MSSLQKTIIIASLLVSTVYNAVANDDITWIRPDSFLIPVDTIYVDNLPCNYVADEITFPTVTPKSPEASAFQKYGENEINEYTGNPAISIPLYTLSYKGIEVPLSLTYDGGGIQVSQEASWVGLGWSLNVGGCINYVCQGGNDQWLGRYGSWKNDYYRILNSNPDLGLKNEQLYLANQLLFYPSPFTFWLGMPINTRVSRSEGLTVPFTRVNDCYTEEYSVFLRRVKG